MNQNLVEVILRLRDEASRALRAYQQAAEQARAANQSLQASLGQVQRGLEGLGSSLGAILGSAGLGAFLKSAADTAFEAESQMRVLARTAQAAGQDFNVLRRTLDEVLQPLGVLPEQAASATAQLLRAGLSTQQIAAAFQAGAASALAAGKTAREGIENVAMALSTGQSIYLNYIGIAENIGPVMQKVASAMEGASQEAIQQAQAQAALNVILKATQQEVAALPDLLGGYAGAQSRLNQTLYEFRRAIGEAVLPYLTALINLANDVVGSFNRLDAETKRQIGTWAALSGGTLAAATALGALLPVLRNTWTVITGLGNALLWLVRSPIGLVITGVAALASAWASAGGDLEEARERVGLLVQALQALYYGAKGTAEAVVGLFRNIGQTLAGVWAAISKALTGDFAGAWQEVQRVLNLERWAANLTQANQDLAQAGRLLAATWRGEVTPEAQAAQERIRSLAQRVQEAVQGAQSAPPPLSNMAQGVAGVGQAAGEATQKAKDLTDVVDVLRKRYELGDLTLAQYLQSLQALLSKWEPHLQGLKAGTEEWQRYADAVLAAKRAIEDSTTAASRMTRAEQERRAPRDWSGVMTGPEVGGVEGWQNAILDTIRLGSTAYGRLMDQISALEARLARGGLSQGAEKELRALLEIAQETAQAWEKEIRSALEREQDDMVAQARALGESVGEAIPEGIAEGFTSVQNALAQRIQEELESLKLDIPGGLLNQLEEDLAAVRAAVLTGVVPESDLPQLLSDIADRAEQMARNLYESGELSASAFLQVWERIKRVREEVGAMVSAGPAEMQRQAEEAARVAEEAARNQIRIISEVMAEAEKAGQIDIGAGLKDLLQGPLYSVMTAVQTGALSASEGIYALYDAAENARRALIALYEAGEISAEEFQRGTQSLALYEGAIADLRMQVLQSIGPIVELENAVGEMGTGDFAPELTAAMSRLDEFRSYLNAIAEIEDPVERLRQLADLEGWLASAMPGLEELIRALEESGINADIVREVLETLIQRMRELGDESKRVQLDQEAQRWTRAIQQVASAIQGISDAFNAPTFGQGIAKFASSIGQLAALIPGGQIIGELIGAVGGLVGWLWDGIQSVFDDGMGRVQQTIEEAADRLKLISEEAFQGAVESYQESYLFGLIRVTKYRINEALMESLQAIAGALEGGVLSGVRNAAKAFLRGAADWANALREGIREAIENAIIEAIIQGAIVKGAIGKLLDQLTAALATGDYGLASGIISQIAGAIPELVARLEGVLAPIRGALNGFGGGEAAATGVSAIRYELPSVTMASPSWVSEMGSHVAEFGAWVRELTERGVRVRVERESWSVLAAAIA